MRPVEGLGRRLLGANLPDLEGQLTLDEAITDAEAEEVPTERPEPLGLR